MSPSLLALLAQLLQIELSPQLEQELLGSVSTPHSPDAQRILSLHKSLKEHYVKHRPTAFRVVLGHHDYDRYPGALALQVNDEVQLIALTTEKYIPARIKELPEQTGGVYYRGVITQQLVANSIFQEGDSVFFTEDQVNKVL